MSVSQKKRQLRRECFSRIKQLNEKQRSQNSLSICEQIAKLEEFKKAKTVFAYLSMATEPDLNHLFSNADKAWAFSVVLSNTEMEFRNVNPDNFENHLFKGDFGILEPDPHKCPLISPADADLVILPGVGFCSRTGNRLGRGKGHYDRYLAKIEKIRGSLPSLLGVCFDVQIVSVPTEAHDIPMTRVVTNG